MFKKTSLGKTKITSQAFSNNSYIPKQCTCEGEDISPPLTIVETPTNTKSLVLIVDDPDAPMGTWVHWVVFNINPTTKEIKENSIPQGSTLGKNDFGKLEYGGPCPPSGTHRYFFKIYALDTSLNLPEGTTKAEVEKAIEGHVLDRGELMGLYKKG
jgi:Raf kinase inhibitor-like YbhB/YbcL family protein